MSGFNLDKKQTALLVVDVQEKVFAAVSRGPEVLQTIVNAVQGFRLFNIPIIVSEQYPKGLGPTVQPLKELLGSAYKPMQKTTFSCMDDPEFFKMASTHSAKQWVVVGIEAHICVLQTAKGLKKIGKEVVVLNDAITSRSIYDFSTAIAEMRDEGIRVSSLETVLFELTGDSQAPEFKQISKLVQTDSNSCCC
jgi:nicotinamidase-related amidase